MLNLIRRKRRPPQHQIQETLLSTARVLLEGNQYTVPLSETSAQTRHKPTSKC